MDGGSELDKVYRRRKRDSERETSQWVQHRPDALLASVVNPLCMTVWGGGDDERLEIGERMWVWEVKKGQ